ncbi:MAG TPA: phage minor tail protein L [Maribacter sp.]|nr:phage minor tail protein L [Maribacter sp.]|tara:strand:+ start:244 stop:816 length:573 start_codon:yes stop_codon:yes gene_type:complete
MAIPVSELQKINPSSIIELFTLELDNSLHGNSNIFRFHAGVNEFNNDIIWQGDTYSQFPVQAEGFEFTGTGQLPRPTFTVSNILSTITALMIQVNTVTPGNDLNGAKFTRIRTHARYLDDQNFVGNSNPYGTPSNTEHPREIYFIDRKIVENRQIVSFELVSKMVLDNLRLPRRQVTRDIFPGVGGFMNA